MHHQLRASLFDRLAGRVFYGWVVVAVASLVMFGTGPGQSHLIGLFFDPISAELGLSRTSIALAYGGATLVAALLLPRMGRLVDRHGPAGMLSIVVGGLGLACILFGFATGWLYLALGFAALRFLGQGSLMLNCANMVSHWFERRRGFALGCMALGFPISIALHPPLVQWLIEWLGWRQTWVWLGIATWVLLLPPALLLLYNRPEDVGLAADGRPGSAEGAPRAEPSGLTLAEALRTPAFYILAAGLASLSMLVTALHVENKGILTRHGLDAQTAANMFAVTGIVAALAMPIVGRMLDRFETKWMFFGGLLVMVASLISVTFVEGLWGAVGYAIVFGLNNGVTMTYFSFMWPRFFGRRHLGQIQGTGQMIGIVGASLGPLPLGLAIDLLGDYDLTLRLLAVIPAGCAVAALFLKAPRLD
ncbi:MAG: MFS transporter [Alphaproteobacteria bacterium]|jgi:MFS family permease|nr:MFS transporter [Alphaproteobacteria bacterium]